MWSVRGGAADGLYGAGDDVQIWCVLLFGSELSLVAFGRGDQDIQGRGGAAEEEACGAVWVLRSGGVSVRRGLQAREKSGGNCWDESQVGCPDRLGR